MTIVINLFGGPGSGKSTLAAELFASFKKQGKSVELVSEYVKGWAWEGKQVGLYDQLYLLGKQTHYESRLYDKVDFVITDSPVLMCPFYEFKYQHSDLTFGAATAFIRKARENNVLDLNFWLPSIHPYQSKGRYQSAAEASQLSDEMYSWLVNVVREDLELELAVLQQSSQVDYITRWVEALA